MQIRTILLRLMAGVSLAGFAACASVPADTVSGHPVVTAYTAAFNARDAETMGTMVHEDIEWLSVTDDGTQVESAGREPLIASMEAYFSAPQAVTSELSGWAVAGNYVSTTETVHWTDDAGADQSQSSLVVYELTDDDLIRRVWYFPSVDAE